MIDKILLNELKFYRKLMGLPQNINEQDEKITNEDKNLNIVNAVFGGGETTEITELLKKTNKTLDQLLTSKSITSEELDIIVKIAKIKNLSSYNTIMNEIYNSEDYKKVVISEYVLELNLFIEEMKSRKGITKYEQPSCVKEFTYQLINLLNKSLISVEKIILDYYNSSIKPQWVDYEMTDIANQYSQHILDQTDYVYLSTEQPNYSGWKYYIYGENTTDVIDLLIMVGDYLKGVGVVFKASTKNNLDSGTNKGLIIYLPYDMVINKKQKEFIDKINSEITNYTKTGTIKGAKSYNGKIFYSYEFNKKFKNLPKGGVKYNELSKYYVPNVGGDYMKNIKQVDLFGVE